MKSVFDQGRHALCPNPFNLAAHVLARADELHDKVALSVLRPEGRDDWTYGALKSAVLGTAAGLLARGLVAGDIVLMRLGNTVEFPLAYLGCIAAGLVPVPTSSQLTAPEVARMIATLKPALILRGAGVACPDDSGVAMLDEAALEAMRGLAPAAYDMGDPDRLAYIIYTSGTSGVPRAVAHAHRAIWARQMMHEGWYGLGENDRMMHAGAFNWTYTLGTGLMDPWSVGATALIPVAGTEAGELPGLMARHGATIFAAAPGVYRKMLSHVDTLNLPDLRHGLSAGEKLSDTIRAHWTAATGCAVFEAYGMSECSTFISGGPAHPARDGALGQPQIGRRVAIVGPEGPVDMGHEGTIAIDRADPGLMLGYLGAEDETAARMQGTWFLTGDQGVMAADGQISYLGRADDMMNAGGYRVSPIEVEAALAQHPALREVGVTDIEIKPDVRVIAAFYVAKSNVSEAELTTFCEARLARYKQPRLFVPLEALPQGANGKILRRALRGMVPGR